MFVLLLIVELLGPLGRATAKLQIRGMSGPPQLSGISMP
jgi:hypothetical protein